MGTNCSSCSSGSTTSGGARGGLRHAADADLGRPARDRRPSVPDGALRAAARCAPPPRSSARTRTGPPRSTAPRPTTSSIRNWPVDAAAAAHRARRRRRRQGRVLGQTVVEQALRRQRRPVGPDVRIKNVPFQVVGVLAAQGPVADGAGLRRRRVRPVTTFQAKIQGGLQKFIPGTIFVERHQPATSRRRAGEQRHARCCASATASPTARDDDFSIRNLAEIASAQGGEHRDATHAAGQHRRACRCWWAASAS